MTDNPKTCVDPYLESFAQSFAAANYTAGTIRTYRHLTRKLGRLMDTAGIVPSALSPALADQLARTPARGPDNRIRFHNLARRFAEHLVDIGVAQPVPLTAAQIARAALLADYEAYLVKQRGLSPRTIYHVLRFADRFLDHRFGTAMIDLTDPHIRQSLPGEFERTLIPAQRVLDVHNLCDRGCGRCIDATMLETWGRRRLLQQVS
jgi:hypothetical protein